MACTGNIALLGATEDTVSVTGCAWEIVLRLFDNIFQAVAKGKIGVLFKHTIDLKFVSPSKMPSSRAPILSTNKCVKNNVSFVSASSPAPGDVGACSPMARGCCGHPQAPSLAPRGKYVFQNRICQS